MHLTWHSMLRKIIISTISFTDTGDPLTFLSCGMVFEGVHQTTKVNIHPNNAY